jgi:hypothetical protein
MVNECGEVDRMRIYRDNGSIGRKPVFVHHKSLGSNPSLRKWDAGEDPPKLYYGPLKRVMLISPMRATCTSSTSTI